MKTKLANVLLAVSAALAGCKDGNKGQEAQTVGWFLDHQADLATPRQSRSAWDDG